MKAVGIKSNYLFSFLTGLFITSISVAVFTDSFWLVAIPFIILLFYAGWQYRNIIFFLLLASLPISFEYNFSSGLGTDIPDEFLMLLVSVLFFAYYLYSPKVICRKVYRHPLLLLLFVVICWSLLSVMFSTDQLISVKYLLAKSWYIGAFVFAPLILFREKKSIITAAIILVNSMLLIAIIALFRHYQTGFSFATINDAVYPFFRNHVNYSSMLVCMIPVLFAFYKLTNSRRINNLLLMALAVSLVALFFSFARGAWLALLAGALAWWLIKTRLLFKTYIASIVISVLLLFWIKSNDRYLEYAHDYQTTIFHKDFSEHLISTYKLKDVSTAERFYRWIAGVRMIKDNWLTGTGPNTFYDNYKGYTIPAYKTWVSDNPEHSTVHNYFLLTAIEQGIPGLFFFLILLGAMIYYTQYLYFRIEDLFYRTIAVAIGSILSMIIVLNSLSDLIETDKIGSIFFLCLSLLIMVDSNSRKDLNSSPDIQRIS